MCIEFAFKRAGIPIIRNFLHQAEGVYGGLPKAAQSRMQIYYKIRRFQHGKEVKREYVNNLVDAYLCKKKMDFASETKELEKEIHKKIKDIKEPEDKMRAIAMHSHLKEKKKLENKMELEIHQIHLKYDAMYKPLYQKVNIF